MPLSKRHANSQTAAATHQVDTVLQKAIHDFGSRLVLVVLTMLAFVFVGALSGCGATSTGTLRMQAEHAMDKGDYDLAAGKLSIVLERSPADWRALYYTGLIRLKQKSFLDARLKLESAYALRDEHRESGDILDALAEAYLQGNENEKLSSMLRSATTRYGKTRDYLREAQYLAKSGDADGAETAFVKATRFAKSDDITPWMKAADFYQGIGDTDNALIALNHALNIQPKNLVILRRIRDITVKPASTLGAKLN